MANKSLGIFLLIATIVTQATWVRAKSYDVGDDKGWSRGVDYEAWLKGKEFFVGDNLVFLYDRSKNNVVIVEEEGYNNCDSTNPVQVLSPCWRNEVTMIAAGTAYIISGKDGDCQSGMKLRIEIKPCPALQAGRNALLKPQA